MIDFDRLRRVHGQCLTVEDHAHICAIIERFAERAYSKFAKGAAEHGGHLLHKPVLGEAYDEGVDQVIYIDTAIQQSKNGGVVLQWPR